MIKKLSVGVVFFSYGGNGGISSEHPDLREWFTPIAVNASRDQRIERLHVWTLADTPITMTRNRAVIQAREMGLDVLVMVDSDMKPDADAGQPGAKPFFDSSFEYIYNNYEKGPVVIGVPYCGPPPHECVYVFRWQNRETGGLNPDYQLEMIDRHTAVKMAGIQECAALPTGLIMYDMRCFELTEPKEEGDKPWFYYEFDLYGAQKQSTEDVTNTRDISLVGIQKLGYNPVMCNWDAWAGHWKPKCVGKPVVIDAAGVSKKLTEAAKAGHDSNTKIVDIKPNPLLARLVANHGKESRSSDAGGHEFDNMGLITPDEDLKAIENLVYMFKAKYGRDPRVLEVGSWAGASAIAFARAGACRVMCVDTWEGSQNDEGTKQYDGSRGTPFEVFLRNTRAYPQIHPHRGRSPEAADSFQNGFYDIVYLDAEHDEESVYADGAAFMPKAKHILAGHDYGYFPGVAKAIERLGLDVEVQGRVWWANVGKE